MKNDVSVELVIGFQQAVDSLGNVSGQVSLAVKALQALAEEFKDTPPRTAPGLLLRLSCCKVNFTLENSKPKESENEVFDRFIAEMHGFCVQRGIETCFTVESLCASSAFTAHFEVAIDSGFEEPQFLQENIQQYGPEELAWLAGVADRCVSRSIESSALKALRTAETSVAAFGILRAPELEATFRGRMAEIAQSRLTDSDLKTLGVTKSELLKTIASIQKSKPFAESTCLDTDFPLNEVVWDGGYLVKVWGLYLASLAVFFFPMLWRMAHYYFSPPGLVSIMTAIGGARWLVAQLRHRKLYFGACPACNKTQAVQIGLTQYYCTGCLIKVKVDEVDRNFKVALAPGLAIRIQSPQVEALLKPFVGRPRPGRYLRTEGPEGENP